MPPWLATWIPNILLGGARPRAAALQGARDAAVWSARGGPARGARPAAWPAALGARRWATRRAGASAQSVVGVVSRLGRGLTFRANILDGYIGQMYVRVFGLTFVGAARHLPDLDVHRPVGQAVQGHGDGRHGARVSCGTQTPQFMYYCIPLSVLIGGLVTVGLLTRNSELIVMRACGISLYRVGGAAAGVRARRERRAVPVRGERAGVLEPARRGAPARHPRRLARAPSTCSTGSGSSGARARSTTTCSSTRARNELNGFSVFKFAPKAVAAAEPRVLQDRRVRRPRDRARRRRRVAGEGRLGAGVRSQGGRAGIPGRRRDRHLHRAAPVLHDRAARGRPHDLPAAHDATSSSCAPAAST